MTTPTQPDSVSVSAVDTKTLLRDGYNANAERYLAWTLPTPTPRLRYIQKLFTHLETASQPVSQSTLLELGCGAGIPGSVALASTCHRLLANDISSTQLDLAAKNLAAQNLREKVQLIESDMCALDLSPYLPGTLDAGGGLDGVVAFYSLIHLTLDDQRTMLRRIHDWLKPGGLLVGNFGAKEDDGKVVEGWLGMTAFWSSFGIKGTLAVVEDCGFDVVESEVVADEEGGGVVVEFLWVVARRK